MRIRILEYTRHILLGVISTSFLLTANCRNVDEQVDFDEQPAELVSFGEWSPSSPLRFRVLKIEELEQVDLGDRLLDAPGNSRFVLVTLSVIPASKGEGRFHFTNKTALVDSEGNGHIASASRFKDLNAADQPVKIETGWFTEKVVPFLVGKNFKPHALRCENEDGDAVYLALRRE